jgi:NADH-quinone oxidoreductase subunit B
VSDRTPEILRGAIPVAPGVSAAEAAAAKKADADPEAGRMGPGWMVTRLDDAVAWARKNSLWPYAFGTACCAIEFMSVVSAHYDLARFGAEVLRFSPRQADLLIVAGTVTDKMGPVLRQIYDQMLEPKWVIAMGVCASSGGFYRAYHVMQGIDEVVPVDVYVPGCPPTPEGLIDGIRKLQERIQKGENARAVDRRVVPAGRLVAQGGTH